MSWRGINSSGERRRSVGDDREQEMPVVWIVNPFDDLPGEGSGPLRYWTLAEEAARVAGEVVWWSSDFSHRRKARRFLPDQDLPFQIELVPTPAYRRNVGLARPWSHRCFARRFHRLARAAVEEGRMRKPTHLIVSSPPLGTAQVAFRLRESWGSEVTLDIMDAWPETFVRVLPGGPNIQMRLGRIFFAKWFRAAAEAYAKANKISAVSQTYLGLAETAGTSAPLKLCYHGVDFRGMEEPPRRSRSQVLRVAYIGAMGASYDLETVFRAMKKLDRRGVGIDFRLAGGGPKEEALRGLCSSLRLTCVSENPGDISLAPGRVTVRFHGYYARPELLDLLAESDVGLIPLLPESWVALPYKVGDYSAAGLAVVSGLGGELDDLLKDFDAGLSYTPGDADALAEILSGLAGDAERLARYQRSSRRMAEELFDRRRTYPEMVRWILKS
jgi:glycosyltransferase involved in cell wall biosynthesis